MTLTAYLKRLISISKFIWNHPVSSKNKVRAFYSFFTWQFFQTIHRRSVKRRFIENSFLVIEKGMVGATGNIYTGLVEFEDMGFLLHVLRSEDTFADVGANVGAYTVLASKNCGAKSFSFEPVSSTFDFLERNIAVNNLRNRVHLAQIGIGEKNGVLRFTTTLDSENHVLSDENDLTNSIKVPVFSLDDKLRNNVPQVIKIDVEGFEWKVLQGASATLSSRALKAIIIELNGSANRYGFSEAKIHSLLQEKGFEPYRYEPFSRQLTSLQHYGQFNTIYINDPEWVKQRIATARPFRVFGQKI